MEILHLLFAINTLVFCEASYSQMIYSCWLVERLLIWFKVIIIVLEINLEKVN